MKIELCQNFWQFFRITGYQTFDTREKTKKISLQYPYTSRRISIETWLKDWSPVFLEKSELQLVGTSILFPHFGIYSMWKLQNSMFQHNDFRNKSCYFFFITERHGYWENDPHKLKKVQLLTFTFRKFNRSTEFWIHFGCLGKTKMKNDETEHWSWSILTAVGLSWTIKIPMKRAYQSILKWTFERKRIF